MCVVLLVCGQSGLSRGNDCSTSARLQVLVLGNKNDLPNAFRETELIERL